MFDEKKVYYTVSLVDDENPDYISDDLIYDVEKIDGKIILTKEDYNSAQVDPNQMCFITPYVKHEVSTIKDIKEALSKKKVVREYDSEDALIISNFSDEDSFFAIFGDEVLQEIDGHNKLVYFVKGKAKKMKIGDFVERENL